MDGPVSGAASPRSEHLNEHDADGETIMAETNDAPTTITAFNWVPDFAKGQVRDHRIRWALEEIGRDYKVELLDATKPRPDHYKEWQPFGQVPAFDDGEVRLFETGAILLYLGEQDQRLLPTEQRRRFDTTAWLFAALSSIEPFLIQVILYDIFHADKDWAEAARPAAVELVEQRLADLSRALGERDWLSGDFTVADIAMVTVLRILDHTDILSAYPKLVAYRKRGMDRPAFQRAIDAQIAVFAKHQPAEAV